MEGLLFLSLCFNVWLLYLTDEELEALKNDRDTFLMAPRCFFSQERLEKLEEIAGEMLKRRFGV